MKVYEWPDLVPCSKPIMVARASDINRLEFENNQLKAENERLRIALMELEALVKRALGG